MKRLLTALDLGRLAVGNPALFIYMYAMSKSDFGELLEEYRSDRTKKGYLKTVKLVSMGAFGNFVQLYDAGFLSVVELLRLCDGLDDRIHKVVGVKNTAEEQNEHFKDLADMSLLSFDAATFVHNAGGWDWDIENNLAQKFIFDPDIVRDYILKESKQGYDRGIRKSLRRKAKNETDEQISYRASEVTKLLCKELVDEYASDKEIRATMTDTEKYLREHYDFEESTLMKIRDTIEASKDTHIMYISLLDNRATRLERLKKADAPGIILINEIRILREHEALALLADYVTKTEKWSEELTKFVADSYVELSGCIPKLCVEGATRETAYKYDAMTRRILDRIREKMAAAV